MAAFEKINIKDFVAVKGERKKNLGFRDENCKTIINFKKYGRMLDAKWDKFERIVKSSRDITIESKRIIFLLHTIKSNDTKSSILNEAEKRLESLISNQFKKIAKELHNEDPYLYHRAYAPGIEEFLEAFTFFNYLKNENVFHWNYYQDKLKYDLVDEASSDENIPSQAEKMIFTTLIPNDFFLGLADMTGEVMRKCINDFGSDKIEDCFKTCSLVRKIYTGLLTITMFSKEMSHKMSVVEKSLLKMEMICFNICVRGSELTSISYD